MPHHFCTAVPAGGTWDKHWRVVLNSVPEPFQRGLYTAHPYCYGKREIFSWEASSPLWVHDVMVLVEAAFRELAVVMGSQGCFGGWAVP